MPTKKKKVKRHLGTFQIANGKIVPGELTVKGPKSVLTAHGAGKLQHTGSLPVITGRSSDGKHLTLVDCVPSGGGTFHRADSSEMHYTASYFPHFVIVGPQHLDPQSRAIKSVHFTTDDLYELFYDFDAFSHLVHPEHLMDDMMKESRSTRPIEIGPNPQIAYFTGKHNIVTVDTAIGEVSVTHRPASNMGGPRGIYIKNQIFVTVNTSRTWSFKEAMNSMSDVVAFLVVAAGRAQKVKKLSITLENLTKQKFAVNLDVIPSFQWRDGSEVSAFQPHPGDVPLDPIRRASEFQAVMSGWLNRQSTWRIPRSSYLASLMKANSYSPERLVASANMFDLIPPDFYPKTPELSGEMLAAKDTATKAFKAVSSGGFDREDALNGLGRIGRWSLTKKALLRESVIRKKVGLRLANLDLVLRYAIKYRNYFVHGSLDIDAAMMAPHLAFFTDALEFTFAASDLIDASWDITSWITEPHAYGHSFTRFCLNYRDSLEALQQTLASMTPEQK